MFLRPRRKGRTIGTKTPPEIDWEIEWPKTNWRERDYLKQRVRSRRSLLRGKTKPSKEELTELQAVEEKIKLFARLEIKFPVIRPKAPPATA
jgi:hypothetical protein